MKEKERKGVTKWVRNRRKNKSTAMQSLPTTEQNITISQNVFFSFFFRFFSFGKGWEGSMLWKVLWGGEMSKRHC